MTIKVHEWETGPAGSGTSYTAPQVPTLEAPELERLLMDSPVLAARLAEMMGGRGPTGRAGSRLTELLSGVPYGNAAGAVAERWRDKAAPYMPGTQGTANPDWQLSTPDPGGYDMGEMGWLPHQPGLREKLGLDQLEQLYRDKAAEHERMTREPTWRDRLPDVDLPSLSDVVDRTKDLGARAGASAKGALQRGKEMGAGAAAATGEGAEAAVDWLSRNVPDLPDRAAFQRWYRENEASIPAWVRRALPGAGGPPPDYEGDADLRHLKR